MRASCRSSCCTAWKWRVASDGQPEAAAAEEAAAKEAGAEEAAAEAAAAAWPEAAAVRQRMSRTPVFTLRCANAASIRTT